MTLVRNLRYAAQRLKAAGIVLLIEPLNTRDVPGFFLSRSAQALDVIRDVGVDNLFLQYDVYHMQVMEGDLAGTIARSAAHIAHIQIADSPGRHEPGTGEIDYAFLLPFLDRIGYAGWVGCEYLPAAGTTAGLGWARSYLGLEATPTDCTRTSCPPSASAKASADRRSFSGGWSGGPSPAEAGHYVLRIGSRRTQPMSNPTRQSRRSFISGLSSLAGMTAIQAVGTEAAAQTPGGSGPNLRSAMDR